MIKENNSSQIITGVFLICLGVVLLLNSIGVLSWGIWSYLIRFWPLMLVFIGLNILLRKTLIWWLLPAFIIIIFAGLIFMGEHYQQPFFVENNFFNIFRDDEYSGRFKFSRDFKDNLDQLALNITYKAGRLNINDRVESSKLIDANLQYYLNKPVINYSFSREDSTGEISIIQNRKLKLNSLSVDDWRISLTRKIPLKLNIEAGAGQINLDLSKLQVEQLDVHSGVNDISVKFNDYSTRAVLTAGASNINISVPAAAALRITTLQVITNNNFKEAGLIRLKNNFYQSRNYGEAESIINLEIKTSAANINLNYQ